MHDFHTHTLHSDGELLPSELIQRAVKKGYETIALTDHVDFSNIESVLKSLKRVESDELKVLRGVELTHVPPQKINKLVSEAKKLGADIIVVHGETPVEPVAAGTNKVAVSNNNVNILAHPGLITVEEVEIAKENCVFLEITSRAGHSLTNGHVARVANAANIIFSTDTHHPQDLVTEDDAKKVLRGAGLSEKDATDILKTNPQKLLGSLR
jgi:histidinol phosphatase-like PHP family hydrolase